MNTIQPIDNDADCVPLYLPQSLFLKPFARINVSVTLPPSVTGKPISNFDIMEKLRSMVQPERFAMLKVSKSTLEFIRFEGELENSKEVNNVLARLDGRNIKLANFAEHLKVRSSLAKDSFPSRHSWDSYFRDARDMDEMKPGERPDTVHLSNLPIRWFCPRHQENDENVRPSESIFKRLFEKFGQVRAVDIPCCDPYRKEMKSQLHTFSHDNEQYFNAFVQFEEYLGFTEAMRALRNMKLVRKEQKSYAINISVDFDRTKHLSDASVKRRKVVRDRCITKEQARDEEERKKKAAELDKKEQEKKQEEAKRQLLQQQQLERENKRKEKQLQKLRSKEQVEISSKIRAEEKKLQLAQKKLEGIRVLEALFERIKMKAPHKSAIKKEGAPSVAKGSHRNGTSAPVGKADLRNKIATKFKTSQEEDVERQRNRLMLAKSSGLLGAALKAGGGERSPSVTSISSDDSVLSDSRQKKKKKKSTKKKKKKKKEGSSSSSVSSALSDAEPAQVPALLGHHPPGAFPMYNPETGQWMGMGMYPSYGNPFFPPGPIAARAEYYQQQSMGYRGGGASAPVYRGGPRGRYMRGGGRGGMRGGRGGYNDGSQHRFDDEHDNRRGRFSRSRSVSRGRRSYSRSRSHRSRSRSRRSQSKTKKKLVSTLRKSNSSTRWSSRSRSPSRSKDRRSWSRKSSSRSRSRSRHRRHHSSRSRSRTRSSRSRSHKRSRHSSHSRTRSRSHDKKRAHSSPAKSKSRTRSNGDRSRDKPPKRVTTPARTPPLRSRSRSRERGRRQNNCSPDNDHKTSNDRSTSSRPNRPSSAERNERRSRSPSSTKRSNASSSDKHAEPSIEERNGRAGSVDSSAFQSPKRKPANATPDRIFDDAE